MYDVYDCGGPDFLQIFDECPGVTSVCVWRVDAFRREIIQLLVVGVHYYLLLIGVLERLRPLGAKGMISITISNSIFNCRLSLRALLVFCAFCCEENLYVSSVCMQIEGISLSDIGR